MDDGEDDDEDAGEEEVEDVGPSEAFSKYSSLSPSISLCPGSKVEVCVSVCPGTSPRVYSACVQGCADRCPQSWYSHRTMNNTNKIILCFTIRKLVTQTVNLSSDLEILYQLQVQQGREKDCSTESIIPDLTLIQKESSISHFSQQNVLEVVCQHLSVRDKPKWNNSPKSEFQVTKLFFLAKYKMLSKFERTSLQNSQ